MPMQTFPLCTAFAVHQRIAAGTYPAVAEALADQALPAGSFLVFDDATGRQVDYPWPAGYAPQQPAQAHIDDLGRRIAAMQAMQRSLQQLVGCCQGDGRPDCPILDDLAAGQDRTGLG